MAMTAEVTSIVSGCALSTDLSTLVVRTSSNDEFTLSAERLRAASSEVVHQTTG